ncbi:MAG TPA: response regulator receiver domain, partial [Pyrinomonadaceae bacterium]
MPFTNTAKKIIEDSILSSLYIDDKIVEPFEKATDKNKKYYNVSKGLYSSFKKKNKSIDFYKFKAQRDWRSDADYIFRNRDLLVLDWQLDDAKDLKQTDTLEILRRAVET